MNPELFNKIIDVVSEDILKDKKIILCEKFSCQKHITNQNCQKQST